MNIISLLKSNILNACQKNKLYCKVYAGSPLNLKDSIKVLIKKLIGTDYIRKADYIVFYIIPYDMNDKIYQTLCDANNSLGFSPAYSVKDFTEIRFPVQDMNKSYVILFITRELLNSLDFIKNADINNGNPVSDIDVDQIDQGHPLEAITYAEENNLGPNDSIIEIFTPEMKFKLSKMIKHGEFTLLESAILKMLLTEECTIELLGVMLGAASTRTKGKPMSKVAALKLLNTMLDRIAKKTASKIGKKIELSKLPEYRRALKKQEAEKKKNAAIEKKKYNALQDEFFALLDLLNKEQRKHGLKPSYYGKIWTLNTQSLDLIAAAKGDHFKEA